MSFYVLHIFKTMTLDPSKIYKVTHSIQYRGRNEGIFKSDLQHDEDRWWVVLEWTTNHDGEYPSLRHPVEDHDLRPLGPAEVLLECPVEIPEHPTATEVIATLKARR